MSERRTITLNSGSPTKVVCLVGEKLDVNVIGGAPPGSLIFSVKSGPNVTVDHESDPPPSKIFIFLTPWFAITVTEASQSENDRKLSVWYYDATGDKVLGKAVLHITAVDLCLDVDADRDGLVEKNHPKEGSWTWGPNGRGAILLVNCDSENTRLQEPDAPDVSALSDLKDMSVMRLRTRGPANLPGGYKLIMHLTKEDARRVRVYRASEVADSNAEKKYPLVLSSEEFSKDIPYGGATETDFYVEGLCFPDKDFSGRITINLSLEFADGGKPDENILAYSVVFRVAPWIMTPNTLKPMVVYACLMQDNSKFIDEITRLAHSSNVKMEVLYYDAHQGDRWMQDELEFGYVDSPHHQFPVVLDSPRDWGLKDFSYKVLLGPDFGYKRLKADRSKVNTMDSFGNLEVSPPVEAYGLKYPLGRIIIGAYNSPETAVRDMTAETQHFLKAQRVQEPISLHTDWLRVGHVDEMMTFVPAPDRKGFRMLLASPDAAYKLFQRLEKDGHGQAKLFAGKPEETTVNHMLKDYLLQIAQGVAQAFITGSRDLLKSGLGLEDEDIVEVPIMFKFHKPWTSQSIPKMEAFYPNMVNMLVLGQSLGVPKPFGPQVNGRCALEAELVSLLGGLGLTCTFIDDYAPYHRRLGEVHCGSNVRREPSTFRWWNMELSDSESEAESESESESELQ